MVKRSLDDMVMEDEDITNNTELLKFTGDKYIDVSSTTMSMKTNFVPFTPCTSPHNTPKYFSSVKRKKSLKYNGFNNIANSTQIKQAYNADLLMYPSNHINATKGCMRFNCYEASEDGLIIHTITMNANGKSTSIKCTCIDSVSDKICIHMSATIGKIMRDYDKHIEYVTNYNSVGNVTDMLNDLDVDDMV